MNYTLQQLRYLVEVAERGSVSAAARALYVSQPGVSAAVSSLEETFGLQIFIRHHARGVTLTPAGRSFVAAAKSVLQQAQDLLHHARELAHALPGRISLGCLSSLGTFFVPRILETLRAAHPDLNLEIHVGDADSLRQWLRDGMIDLALLFDLNCDSAVYTRRLLTSLRPHVLLPVSHGLADCASVAPADLVDEPLIVLNCTHNSDYLLSVFPDKKKQPKIGHRVGDISLMCALVNAGKGYAIFHVRPTIESSVENRALKWLPLHGNVRTASVVLASRDEANLAGPASLLLNACSHVVSCFDSERCEFTAALQDSPPRSSLGPPHAVPRPLVSPLPERRASC